MRSMIWAIISLVCFFPANPAMCSQFDFKNAIKDVTAVFASRDRKAIAGIIAYPLKRDAPFSWIYTLDDLIQAFDEIFDEKLLKDLSSPSGTDWVEIGWPGAMFQDGKVWINKEGEIIAIGYETVKGKSLRKSLIESDRKKLHGSLQNFLEPIVEFTTQDYRIRLDYMDGYKVRYVSWKISKGKGDKPDIVLNNGDEWDVDEAGGRYYNFKSGKFIYRCRIAYSDMHREPIYELEIIKGEKTLMRQPMVEIICGQ